MDNLKMDIVHYIRTRHEMTDITKERLHHLMRGMMYHHFMDTIGEFSQEETHSILLNEGLLDEVISGKIDPRYIRQLNPHYITSLRVGGLRLRDKYAPCLYKFIQILYTKDLSPLPHIKERKDVLSLVMWVQDRYDYLHRRNAMVKEHRQVEQFLLRGQDAKSFDWVYNQLTASQLQIIYKSSYKLDDVVRDVYYDDGTPYDNINESFCHVHAKYWYEIKTAGRQLKCPVIVKQGLVHQEPHFMGTDILIDTLMEDCQNGMGAEELKAKYQMSLRQANEAIKYTNLILAYTRDELQTA